MTEENLMKNQRTFGLFSFRVKCWNKREKY